MCHVSLDNCIWFFWSYSGHQLGLCHGASVSTGEYMLTIKSNLRTLSQDDEDIFASLLQLEVKPKKPKLGSSSPVTLATCSNVLLTASLLSDGTLIAFTNTANSACCTLNIWKPMSGYAQSELPAFSLQPDSVISHSVDSSCSNSSFNVNIPYLVVCSSTTQQREGVVSLLSELFFHLFGLEETLGQSLIVVYGCGCGLVFGASLKKFQSLETAGSDRQKLIPLCCIDQPVLSIYPLSLSTADISDSLLVIGSLGKILLIKALPSSTISTQEILLSDPLLSTLLIPRCALLLSNLRTIRLICLKPECYRDYADDSFLFHLFEHPLTLLSSPHYLLSYRETVRGHFAVLGLRMEGQLSTIKLPMDYIELLKAEGFAVGDQLRRTLKSIEETAITSERLDSEMTLIDADLTTLNQMCCLFAEQLDSSSPPPLKVGLSMKQEQLDAMKRQYYINVVVSLKKGSSSLRRGCFLCIKMKPGCLGRSAIYLHPQSVINESQTHSLSLEGLCADKSLCVNIPILKHMISFYHLQVTCCLSFSHAFNAVPHSESFVVPLSVRSFSLLDFIQPLKHDRSLITETQCESVCISISDSIITDYVKEQGSSTNAPSKLFGLFINLFGDYRRQEISRHIFKMNDCRGKDSVELFCLLPSNSVARFRFQSCPTEDSNCAGAYQLCITASSLLNAVHLTDVISQVESLDYA